MRWSRLIPTLTVALLVVLPLSAQPTQVQLEAGYQWTDISGNEEVYRSQVDQEDGFVLRAFSLFSVRTPGEAGAYDRLRIDASGYDGSPDGRFRLEMTRDRSYTLRINQSQSRHFNALPNWANPLLQQGVFVSQHTLDRERKNFDVELELFPGRMLTPILGYRFFQYDGPGTTTRHVGEDEFLLDQDLDQEEQELRLGLAFDLGPSFRGSVTQGWRDFEGTERLRLAPGAEEGNNSRPVLGRPVELDDYQRTEETELDGTVTSVLLTGRVGSSVRLFGTYVRSDYDGDVVDEESLDGSLVSFELGSFYDGLRESVTSRSDSPAWRGEARFEADLGRRLTLVGSYGADDYSVDGSALITSLFLNPTSFGGASGEDIQRVLEVDNAYSREQQEVDLVLNARQLGPFRAWVGYRLTSQDIDVAPDAAQIVVPGGQGGEFEREIDALNLGVGLELDRVKLTVEAFTDDADQAVVRTDYLERDRLRVRLDLKIIEALRLLATYENVDAENDTPGIDYRGETDRLGLRLEITPLEELTFDLGWDSYDSDSTLTIRRPETFALVPSIYSEEVGVAEAGVFWHRDRFELEGRYSRFDNEGSLPLEIDRAYLYFGVDIAGPYGIGLDYQGWDYRDLEFSVADYDASRYGVYLRYRR